MTEPLTGLDEAVEALAADIRRIDGAHTLGAGALAELLIEAGWADAAAIRADERAKVLAGASRTREWLVAFEHGPTDGPFDELAEAEEWAQRFPESIAKILTREQAHYVSEWEPTP